MEVPRGLLNEAVPQDITNQHSERSARNHEHQLLTNQEKHTMATFNGYTGEVTDSGGASVEFKDGKIISHNQQSPANTQRVRRGGGMVGNVQLSPEHYLAYHGKTQGHRQY